MPVQPLASPPIRKRCLMIFGVFALLLLGGCTLKSGDGPGGMPPAVRLFSPMTESGAVRLSATEAKRLAADMAPRTQGLARWQDMDFAVRQSLAYASAKPGNSPALDVPGLRLAYGELAAVLMRLRSLLPRLDADPSLLASEFTWYRIGPDSLVTGYYEPTLEASRVKSSRYPYPLYRLPNDVRRGVGYHTRKAIDRENALAGRGLEIAWVSSETDAFFLHIQGSGRLRFPDGSVTHVLYAGKNNRAYVPLGRIMRDEGLLEPDNVNMASIRACLAEHPERCAELFDQNPSYVFFREADEGPVGAMGRPLTPWVSTATDRSILPHGSLVFLTVPLPDKNGDLTVPFNGLTLPQDVGGAIKGRRIDLFCGPEAEHTAGYLNARGAVYILAPK